MKTRLFQTTPSEIGTKRELSQAMQTSFPSVKAIRLADPLILSAKRPLSIASKQITSHLELAEHDKHSLHFVLTLIPQRHGVSSGEIDSVLHLDFCGAWKSDTTSQ
jgi:hypothetical protein